ncbi:hypothetical protein BH23ACT6_BH23ACT6_23680 [soil metagenome]
MEPFEVRFDFTCRFAYRLQLWLGKLDVESTWAPFSLLEAKRDGDGTPVWKDPEHADNISLLMLAGHELVGGRGGDTARYRQRVFAAWHGSDQRLDADSLVAQTHQAGVDADVDDLHGAFALVGERHREAVERGVFGSSTIVFPSGRGSFVRFTDTPDVDNAPAVLAALRTLAEQAPGLDRLEPLRS